MWAVITQVIQLLLLPICKRQVLRARDTLAGLKSLLKGGDDTITVGIKLSLFCFFWPSSYLGCLTPFYIFVCDLLLVCFWEAKIWKLLQDYFQYQLSWFLEAYLHSHNLRTPSSRVVICSCRASRLSLLEKLTGTLKVKFEFWPCPRANSTWTAVIMVIVSHVEIM